MKIPLYSLLPVIFLVFLSTFSRAATDDFIQCLTHFSPNSTSISSVIYTPMNSSYTSVLQLTINNQRFASPDTPKPSFIVTPLDESQIKTVIFCSKKHDIPIRIRSGGNDLEGLSYRTTSKVSFVLLDMINFKSINIDLATKTAWVQSGATLGQLYYAISQETSTLAFPGGLSYTVGVGGLIGGGGDGTLSRKYGLAADNVIDARMIDVKGRILDRRSMGEDLFWAIRGGGSSSFAVTLSWKIKLVQVPEIVTIFKIDRILEDNATALLHKWQSIAPNLDKDLDIRIRASCVITFFSRRVDKKTIQISFQSLFLGGIDRLLPLMQQNFPELGLTRNDCSQVSWIQAVLFFTGFGTDLPPIVLLNRSMFPKYPYKAKTSYVKEPIPVEGLEGIWQKLFLLAPQTTNVVLTPYGGRMSEISESEIPFPHRAGNLYMLYMEVIMGDTSEQVSLNWTQDLYDYLGPYVSKCPRTSYVNYNDLDLGVNNQQGRTSYAQASIWGKKYFKDNFDRLVRVKFKVDPFNFFRHEQSIPPILLF